MNGRLIWLKVSPRLDHGRSSPRAPLRETKWEMFFRVALTSGLRSGELNWLRWIDVDVVALLSRYRSAQSAGTRPGRVGGVHAPDLQPRPADAAARRGRYLGRAPAEAVRLSPLPIRCHRRAASCAGGSRLRRISGKRAGKGKK